MARSITEDLRKTKGPASSAVTFKYLKTFLEILGQQHDNDIEGRYLTILHE